MTTVAIYTRISRDPDGTQTATHRQERLCRAFAELRGWQIAEVFEDVDLSAYDRTVERPAYERLAAGVEAGAVGGILVWKLDRLVRQPSDFERLWSACERTGAVLASATEPVDSSTELGVAIVRMLVTFANLESATKGVRLKAKFAEMAKSGAPPITARRAFGYEPHARAVIDSEARLIHEAARRVIAGESLTTIARDWNERGVASVTGARWSYTTLDRILKNPLLVGDRKYRGEVVARGTWQPIMDRETFTLVNAVLNRPGPNRAEGRTRYLLSPVMRCGRCGGRMSGQTVKTPKGQCAVYRCSSYPYGCTRVSCRLAGTDTWVVDRVFEYLDSDRLRTLIDDERRSTAGDESAELLVLRRDLTELSGDYYVRRTVDRAAYTASRDVLNARLDAARALIERRMRFPALVRLAGNGGGLRGRWTRLSIDKQREVVRTAVDHISVAPSRRGKRFDTDRFTIAWRI